MTDPVAPPPPGTDTPVPADVVPVRRVSNRARKKAERAADALVPVNAIEQRRQVRARARAEAVLRRQRDRVLAPYFAPRSPAYPAPPPLVLPKRPFTKVQKRAVYWGSLIAQSGIALGTHLISAFVTVGGTIALMQAEEPNANPDPFRSFSTLVSYWTHPDRFWVGLFSVALVALIIAGVSWAAAALWLQHRSVRVPNGTILLAAITTNAIAAILAPVGLVLWPFIMFSFLLSGSVSLGTTGDMWLLIIVPISISACATALFGAMYNVMYLHGFRLRPTLAELESERVEAERRAEAYAQAVDSSAFEDDGEAPHSSR